MTSRRTVVVTGGAGYVGSVVTSHLLLGGARVVVLDRLAAGGESLLGFAGADNFDLIVGDVRDAEVLDRALHAADAVVHLAAVVGEPACAGNEVEARSINLDGARAVLEAVERQRVSRLILVSTCSNYGVSSPDVLADEDAPLNPLGIYARSKVDAELAALAHTGDATVGVLRLGTICGLSPRMRFDLLVNDMARAVVLGETIAIFAPDAWRPFLHIRDAARVDRLGARGGPRTYRWPRLQCRRRQLSQARPGRARATSVPDGVDRVHGRDSGPARLSRQR